MAKLPVELLCTAALKVCEMTQAVINVLTITSPGDVSSTRRDNAIGDSVNFQDDLFDMLLNYVGRYGDSSPESGNYSIVNHKVFQEFKFDRFNQDQQEDKQLQLPLGRVFTTFSEVAFILEFFANGTTTQLSANGLGSIFRNQTFAPNWFRRASPAGLPILANVSTDVRCAHPIAPGANDRHGNYVHDSDAMCNGGFDFVSPLPYSLLERWLIFLIALRLLQRHR